MVGGPVLVAGILWFGWWVPGLSTIVVGPRTILIGLGITLLFTSFIVSFTLISLNRPKLICGCAG
jgi:hypothetical protein